MFGAKLGGFGFLARGEHGGCEAFEVYAADKGVNDVSSSCVSVASDGEVARSAVECGGVAASFAASRGVVHLLRLRL